MVIVVRFNEDVSEDRIREIGKDLKTEVRYKLLGDDTIYVLKIKDNATAELLIIAYNKLPEVDYAELPPSHKIM